MYSDRIVVFQKPCPSLALNDATLFGRELSLSGSTGHTPLKHVDRMRRE